VADIYCRWERRRYQESNFEPGDAGVLVHVGTVPLHTVNGRLVAGGELESEADEAGDSDA
jgi:hypothetical protein